MIPTQPTSESKHYERVSAIRNLSLIIRDSFPPLSLAEHLGFLFGINAICYNLETLADTPYTEACGGLVRRMPTMWSLERYVRSKAFQGLQAQKDLNMSESWLRGYEAATASAVAIITDAIGQMNLGNEK